MIQLSIINSQLFLPTFARLKIFYVKCPFSSDFYTIFKKIRHPQPHHHRPRSSVDFKRYHLLKPRRKTCSKVPLTLIIAWYHSSNQHFPWKHSGRYCYLHLARSSPSSVEIKNSKATSTILQPTVKISFELARPPPLAQIIKLVPTPTNNHQTLSQSTSSTQNPNVNVSRLLTFFVRHHKNNIQMSSCQHHTSACTVPTSCQHSSTPPIQTPPITRRNAKMRDIQAS